MGKYPGVRRRFLSVSFSLMITLGLLTCVNSAGAGSIGPNQGFDLAILLGDQNKEYTTTQTAPFGTHSVFFIALDGVSVYGEIGDFTPTATGVWTLTSLITKGRWWIDFQFGLIPWEGKDTQVDYYSQIGLGVVIASTYVTSPVSPENPFSYSIKVYNNKP